MPRNNKAKLARYPKDWKLRSRFVRFVRAKNKCEWCGVENYSVRNGSKIVLTTAHVYDKSPEVANLLNLAALCQRCHLNHDKNDRSTAPKKVTKEMIAERIKKLAEADYHWDESQRLGVKIINMAIKKYGSVAATARASGMPPSNIHEALKRGSYLAIRNCAHKIVKARKE